MKLYKILVIFSLAFIVSNCNEAKPVKYLTYWDAEKRIKQSEFFVLKDEFHGISKGYYKNGKQKFSAIYKKGKLLEIQFIKDTLGRRLKVGSLKNGMGEVIIYDDDGVKEAFGNYVNGLKDGKWTEYNFNGEIINFQLYAKGYAIYEDSSRIFNNGYH